MSHGELYCTTASRQYFQNNQQILKVFHRCFGWGICFLIGKTGTGKSSLIKTLYADLPLKHGVGAIVGYDLTNIKQKDIPYLRRKLGVVFQDFKLLPDRSVFENLREESYGLEEKSKIEAHRQSANGSWYGEVAPKYPFELSGGNNGGCPAASMRPVSLLPMNPLEPRPANQP